MKPYQPPSGHYWHQLIGRSVWVWTGHNQRRPAVLLEYIPRHTKAGMDTAYGDWATVRMDDDGSIQTVYGDDVQYNPDDN